MAPGHPPSAMLDTTITHSQSLKTCIAAVWFGLLEQTATSEVPMSELKAKLVLGVPSLVSSARSDLASQGAHFSKPSYQEASELVTKVSKKYKSSSLDRAAFERLANELVQALVHPTHNQNSSNMTLVLGVAAMILGMIALSVVPVLVPDTPPILMLLPSLLIGPVIGISVICGLDSGNKAPIRPGMGHMVRSPGLDTPAERAKATMRRKKVMALVGKLATARPSEVAALFDDLEGNEFSAEASPPTTAQQAEPTQAKQVNRASAAAPAKSPEAAIQVTAAASSKEDETGTGTAVAGTAAVEGGMARAAPGMLVDSWLTPAAAHQLPGSQQEGQGVGKSSAAAAAGSGVVPGTTSSGLQQAGTGAEVNIKQGGVAKPAATAGNGQLLSSSAGASEQPAAGSANMLAGTTAAAATATAATPAGAQPQDVASAAAMITSTGPGVPVGHKANGSAAGIQAGIQAVGDAGSRSRAEARSLPAHVLTDASQQTVSGTSQPKASGLSAAEKEVRDKATGGTAARQVQPAAAAAVAAAPAGASGGAGTTAAAAAGATSAASGTSAVNGTVKAAAAQEIAGITGAKDAMGSGAPATVPASSAGVQAAASRAAPSPEPKKKKKASLFSCFTGQ
mmetsp:Transcript_20992/g.45988  ORF Transcript_20992/g.45988 Transcript_20992/m.45988 type:complete len:624 (+) Transcript_20992:222-2093(+)|eukprot:CAMPEP_0202890912 /NCGR_PEP_ID=MMETSP1392-20130828/1162_1 /ASSEMBLY_ACC=CAM_ASM_000868 /TAXON_ID=225041 /ORGANISM="Chlamydomonas chlamydogama, Strain SAG 11-48b" /LENGTH=623 /DNA_ID=CAMNT_0049574565 /DNA_START=214 /DNA_END=2085 /DNA_ORIENTATION=-